jgi:hypothetical protein
MEHLQATKYDKRPAKILIFTHHFGAKSSELCWQGLLHLAHMLSKACCCMQLVQQACSADEPCRLDMQKASSQNHSHHLLLVTTCMPPMHASMPTSNDP